MWNSSRKLLLWHFHIFLISLGVLILSSLQMNDKVVDAVYRSPNNNNYQSNHLNPKQNRGPLMWQSEEDVYSDQDFNSLDSISVMNHQQYGLDEVKRQEKNVPPPVPRLHYASSNNYQNHHQPQYQHQSPYHQQQQPQLQQHQQQPNQNLYYKSRGSQGRSNVSLPINDDHKCRIWIPAEAREKYPSANDIQPDESKMMNLIEICCEGYGPIRWRGKTKCLPLCDNCENGSCVAPGKCECYEGYVQTDNDECVFTCPLGCLNGRCYLDGSCQCDPGFKLDETRKFCRPICSGGCGLKPGHNCTEPEVCGCAKGYKLTDAGCQPICRPECGKGHCFDTNDCRCDPGFHLKDNVCQTDCYQKCDNGICYSRNRCICKPGFTYNERTSQCIPK